jgi:hypothetical protein
MSDEIYLRGSGYYNPDPPILRDLQMKDKEHDDRLQDIEVSLARIEVALYGPDGQNGIRREVRVTQSMVDDLSQKLDSIVPSMLKSLGAFIAGTAAVAASVIAIISQMR